MSKRKKTEAPSKPSKRGLFDLPDGHHMSIGDAWGFEKRGDKIFPAPYVVDQMHLIQTEAAAIEDLVAAVSRYATSAYGKVEERKIRFWRDLGTALGVEISGRLDLVWDYEGSVSLRETAPARAPAKAGKSVGEPPGTK